MDWVTCPKCGFTQIPSEKCLRCERLLQRPAAPKHRPESAAIEAPAPPRMRFPAHPAAIGAASVLLLLGLFFWRARFTHSRAGHPESLPSSSSVAPLNLSGRWDSEISELLPGAPPRPAVKRASIETDHEGFIIAASVVLTDPGRGGAGAGYRMTADGRRRLNDLLPLLAALPSGAPLPIDFIPLPPWVPARQRLWRALEGQKRRPEQVRYLVLESVEDDYLLQIGINESGFLSYAFFSPEYASGRGLDVLSRLIHPEPGSSLRGFQNLVWDLSGAADFLTLEVTASISGPEGVPARLVMKRGTGS